MHARHYKDVFDNQRTLWWYQGMRYLSSLYLCRYLPPSKTSKIRQILDAGCGTGAALSFLSHFGDVIGVDIASEALRYAKKLGNVRKANISNLPFNDQTFDLIYSFGVLYHQWVQDDKKALKEYFRVLKPNGILLIEEPALHWLMGNEDAIAYGKHRYYASEMKERLTACGFSITTLSYVNFFLLPFAILRRLPQVIGLAEPQEHSDIFTYPQFINRICYAILQFEAHILQYIRFPIGMDIICIAKKPNQN